MTDTGIPRHTQGEWQSEPEPQPHLAQPQFQMPQPVKPKRRTPLVAAGAALFLAGVAAGGGGVWFATRPDPAPEAVALHQVFGSITVNQAQIYAEEGRECFTSGGYRDISAGSNVTVTGPDGTVLAVGLLLPGESQMAPGVLQGSSGCRFKFTVTVPAGKSFYGFAVGHRNPLQEPEIDLSGSVDLTLG